MCLYLKNAWLCWTSGTPFGCPWMANPGCQSKISWFIASTGPCMHGTILQFKKELNKDQKIIIIIIIIIIESKHTNVKRYNFFSKMIWYINKLGIFPVHCPVRAWRTLQKEEVRGVSCWHVFYSLLSTRREAGLVYPHSIWGVWTLRGWGRGGSRVSGVWPSYWFGLVVREPSVITMLVKDSSQ